MKMPKLFSPKSAELAADEADRAIVEQLVTQFNTLSGDPNAADKFLKDSASKLSAELKARNPKFPKLYDKWIARLDSKGCNAREATESLRTELLNLQSKALAKVGVSTITSPPTPSAAPVALQRAAVASAQATSGGPSLARLSAIHSLIFSDSATHSILQNRKAYAHGEDRMAEANAKVEEARKYGYNSPALRKAGEDRAKLSLKLAEERAGSPEDQKKRLLQSLLDAGVTVPGSATAGLVVKLRSENLLPPRDRQVAQSAIEDFIKATDSTPNLDVLRSSSPAAHAARSFLMDQGRLSKSGNLELE
jgi:hypothetical protein